MHVFSNLSVRCAAGRPRMPTDSIRMLLCTSTTAAAGLAGWCCLSAIYPHLNLIRHQWVKFFTIEFDLNFSAQFRCNLFVLCRYSRPADVELNAVIIIAIAINAKTEQCNAADKMLISNATMAISAIRFVCATAIVSSTRIERYPPIRWPHANLMRHR